MITEPLAMNDDDYLAHYESLANLRIHSITSIESTTTSRSEGIHARRVSVQPITTPSQESFLIIPTTSRGGQTCTFLKTQPNLTEDCYKHILGPCLKYLNACGASVLAFSCILYTNDGVRFALMLVGCIRVWTFTDHKMLIASSLSSKAYLYLRNKKVTHTCNGKLDLISMVSCVQSWSAMEWR
jgi:hypothetical protein